MREFWSNTVALVGAECFSTWPQIEAIWGLLSSHYVSDLESKPSQGGDLFLPQSAIADQERRLCLRRLNADKFFECDDVRTDAGKTLILLECEHTRSTNQ